jgi:hypothetical protein
MSKRWLGLMLALIIIAVAAWFDWTYRAVRSEVTDLHASLPAVEDLSRPDESAEKLKLADLNCKRVDKLQASPVARLVKGAEVKALADQCDLIRAQLKSQEGP